MGLVAPHICANCGQTGATLCKRCIFNIYHQKFHGCLICFREISPTDFAKRGNLCQICSRTVPFSRIYVLGPRQGILQKLLDDYKFNSQRGGAGPLAQLFAKILPENLPPDLTVVPVTTVAKNVRNRGFDHMKLAGQKLAKIRGLNFAPDILLRTNNLTQHLLKNSRERRENAKKAFAINPRAEIPPRILLIDDIFTTGATVSATAKLLQKSGAREIWLAVLAFQPRKSSAKNSRKTKNNSRNLTNQ